MKQIKFILSYVCLLEVIHTHFGTLAAGISINQNITGILGNKDTNLTCSFVQESGEIFLSVEIIAKNLTEDFDYKKKPIAIFQPKKAAKLHPSGEYLAGRVTLTNITTTSSNVTLTFHLLKCEDEKDYMCKYNFIDKHSAVLIAESEATRILVKVPVRDVRINKRPNHKQYDRKTNNITLACKASGDPKPTYTWFKESNNDAIISRTRFYVIEDIIRNNSGVYICEAYNNINKINYTHSNSVEIDIVDELLSPPTTDSWKTSAGYAVCAVLIIITVGLVVIYLALKKHRSNLSKVKSNEGSLWQNLVDCLISCDCFTKVSVYIPVVRKTNNAAEDDLEDTSNGLKGNKISCGNKKRNTVKTSGISQDISITSSNIYADPKDTLQRVNVEDCGIKFRKEIYEENGASHPSVNFAKVDQTKIKYYTSKKRTSETNDNMDHTEYAVPEDQLQD